MSGACQITKSTDSAFAGAALSPGIEKTFGAAGTGGTVGKLKRVVAAAVVGGVSSRLGGGKFQNGAVTAAFGRLFNHELDSDSGGTPQEQRQGERVLTANEVTAVKSEFPDFDASEARIAYDLSTQAAFTPGNTMHFPKSMSFCQDFITCSEGDYAGWFVHESTHVWQHQNGRSPFWGHIFSRDIFRFGNYLPLDRYRATPTPAGLNTERGADWHMWHYLCTNDLQPGC